MAMFGYDLVESPEIVCACKELRDKNRVFSLLLFSYGTEPDPNSICPDSHARAVHMTQRIIQNCGESLLCEEGSSDMTYSATKVRDALREANSRIRKSGHYVGHGIYIGGAVSYIDGGRYMVIPFGGASAYIWDGNSLIRRGEAATSGIICDALGCTPTWTGSGWQGRMSENGSLITLSHDPRELSELTALIKENRTADRNPNTVAMLLRNELQKHTNTATGAVEIWPSSNTNITN